MLLTLLQTRWRFYRNYVRYHFDRTVKIEIVLILIIFLLLIGRSPADIGYSLKIFAASDFSSRWAHIWARVFLLAFYLVAEVLAWHTLRPSGEWYLLAALPVRRLVVTHYSLLRYAAKTTVLIILTTAPFWLVEPARLDFFLFFLTAAGVMVVLQLCAYFQAYHLRSARHRGAYWRGRWFLLEITMLLALIFGAHSLPSGVVGSIKASLVTLFTAWGLAALLYFVFRYRFAPESIVAGFTASANARPIFNRWLDWGWRHGPKSAMIVRDLRYLLSRQRSTFILVLFAALFIPTVIITQADPAAITVSGVFLEILYSIVLVNNLLILMETDVAGFPLVQALPVTVKLRWRARWLLVAGLLALPQLVPLAILLVQHGTGLRYAAIAAVSIPAVFATIYCNTTFGLFPHTRLCSLLLNVTLMLILLFWFFMPFGSLLLLLLMLVWIHRSQRHLQELELV